MRVAIIGTGNVGGALAQALTRGGHEIVFGVRTPQAGNPAERAIADAVGMADATILAVPHEAVDAVVAAADGFIGKIVIDATNPLRMGAQGLELSMGYATSGAERIAALAPKAKLFKTFNQTGFANMADATGYAARPVMFVAGDDAEAKPLVLALVTDAGFQAVDFGGLVGARLLEPLAMLWIDLNMRHRPPGAVGAGFAFTLQTKGA